MALRQIRRPPLGRATDKRVDATYLTARGLPGNPFDSAQDIDVVDEINSALADIQAQAATQLVVKAGTNAERLALTAGGPLDYAVLFSVTNGPLLRYIPGSGWLNANGGNPDYVAPPPPPADTGVY